ncbi:MAG: phosphatidylglycerol lysyltransferase domain-containing protein [Bacteroidales bacterium]|jgi:hypothetical protein|nr:phosphatidylglycerol lysyltransferase domain-containing protein [Bacteroidales bacterium]
MNFKDIKIEDKGIFDEYLPYKQIQNCETSFANIIAYNFKYHSQFAILDDALCVRSFSNDKNHFTYFMPITKNSGDASIDTKRKIIDSFIRDSKDKGKIMSMIINDCCDFLKDYPNFTAQPSRDFYDYIYLKEDLAELKGRKYQAKRNHINQITKHKYEIIELSDSNFCEFFAIQMFLLNEAKARNPEYANDYEEENRVIHYLLMNYKELDVLGLALRINGQGVAFSLGSPINKDTFDVHIEKATRDNGTFALINREMANRIPSQYLYINREEDLGIEGLRKAKLSYHPSKMIEKCFVTLKQ